MSEYENETAYTELDVEGNHSSSSPTGTSSSRKPSSKSKNKSKKKGSSTSKSRSRSSSKLSPSSSSNSEGTSVGVGKLLGIVFTFVRLVLELVFSLCSGSDARNSARRNLVRWINGCVNTFLTQPFYVAKMVCLTLMLSLLAVSFLDVLGLTPSSSNELDPMQGGSSIRFYFFSSSSELEDDESGAAAAALAAAAAAEGEADIPMPDNNKRKPMTKKLEVKFACDEVECIEKCVRKVTKKCTSSEGCMRQRHAYCKKKCRKARCESRCKFEPQIGYVEREMKLDKCKEECGNSGAGSTKCLDKCEKEFQTCKSRCGERRKKFVCDREPDIPFPSKMENNAQPEADDSADDDSGSGSNEASNAETEIDDEDI